MEEEAKEEGKKKVLVVAPTNVAIDGLLSNFCLHSKNKKILRLGNVSKVREEVKKYAVEFMMDGGAVCLLAEYPI